MDSRFTGSRPSGYTMAGSNIGGYHKRHSKRKTIFELQETLQMIYSVELAASETYRQNCKEVSRVTEGLFWS